MKTSTLIVCLVVLAPSLARSERGIAAATTSLRRYNAEELQLAGARDIAPAQLVAHWQRLGAIRVALDGARLQCAREPERLALRHELSRLLGQVAAVDTTRGWIVPALERAATRRRAALDAIRRWSNRNLDFAVGVMTVADFAQR